MAFVFLLKQERLIQTRVKSEEPLVRRETLAFKRNCSESKEGEKGKEEAGEGEEKEEHQQEEDQKRVKKNYQIRG